MLTKRITSSRNKNGSLSEGYLRLRFGGLIFKRAYFWRDLLSEFYGICIEVEKRQQEPLRKVVVVEGVRELNIKMYENLSIKFRTTSPFHLTLQTIFIR